MLEQSLRSVFEHPPNVVHGPPSGVATALVEADAELAQMTSAAGWQHADGADWTLTLKWMNRIGLVDA